LKSRDGRPAAPEGWDGQAALRIVAALHERLADAAVELVPTMVRL
jgi:hypothetical protein